jgi:4-hydroxybenzoate polyprenyltransferase
MMQAERAVAGSIAEYLRLLRITYWSKNLLVFVPAFLANALQDRAVLLGCLAGFLLLSLCVSGTYILNDIADAQADRAHPTKRYRPIAIKTVDPSRARHLAVFLIMASLGVAALWNLSFAASLLAYCIASAAYTFVLKKLILVEALWLSGMHTSRLLMGVLIADVLLSGWLVAFAMFFFFSLALAKRHCEIVLVSRASAHRVAGRSYTAGDGMLILSFGASSAMASLAVLALYVTDHQHSALYYADPNYLWIAVFIVGVWLIHIWRHAHGATLTSDPINYALHDRISLTLFALLMIVMMAAK